MCVGKALAAIARCHSTLCDNARERIDDNWTFRQITQKLCSAACSTMCKASTATARA
jgi:hypothetical protein